MIRNLICTLLLVFCAAFITPALADDIPQVPAAAPSNPHTEASLISNETAIRAGEKFWVVLHLKMEPGWHTYWRNPGDSGMAPSMEWTLPRGFTASDIQFLPPDRLQEGDLVDYGYSNDAWYPVQITAPAILRFNAISILSVKARWLVCKDICLPQTGEFSMSFPGATGEAKTPSNEAPVIEGVISRLPAPVVMPVSFYRADGRVSFSMPLEGIQDRSVKEAWFFPVDEGFVMNSAMQRFAVKDNNASFILSAAKGGVLNNASGLVSLFLNDGSRKDFSVSLAAGKIKPAALSNISGGGMDIDIVTAVLFALAGGLILNLMPCVFPILALKALAIAKKAEKRSSQVRMHGLLYSIGVIISFLALASLLIVLQMGGKSVGWGYQMQSPMFVLSLAVVFFLIGLSLSGYFELPSVFGTIGQETAARDNLLGSFATGALAVLVATPCTAPFMASAIGFALTQGVEVVIAVFAGLGFGLAAPFLLISIFPKLIRFLPKPGAWMLRLKQAVAFPMYGCALWLLWVLSREAGQDAVFVALLGFIILAFALWLIRLRATFTGLLVAAVAVAGMVEYIHFVPLAQATAVPMPGMEKFSVARLQELRSDGKPVLVDATADWCITCKVNERVALSSRAVRKLLAEKHITLLVADWTHGDKEITSYLHDFGRAGVPIYVYYPPDNGEPVVLPQVLTPSVVEEKIQ